MNRYVKRLLSGACVLGGLVAVGCNSDHPHKLSDPCWPDRYANEARQLTVASFEPQVVNGHLLDLTLWNSPALHFDRGQEHLSAGGMDKLDQLMRRRPQPDSRIFIQTARDIPFDPEKPEAYAAERTKLDTARVTAVKKYLEASLTGRPMSFDIQIHDPAYPGIDGAAPRVIVPRPQSRVGLSQGGAGGQQGGAQQQQGGGTQPPQGGTQPQQGLDQPPGGSGGTGQPMTGSSSSTFTPGTGTVSPMMKTP